MVEKQYITYHIPDASGGVNMRELFNENHDPETGQFAEGGGSSGGGSSGSGSPGGGSTGGSHPSLASAPDQVKNQMLEGSVYDGETYTLTKNDYKKISTATPEQLKDRAAALADLDKERLGKRFGLAKREKMRQSLMPTKEYREGLGQGKLDKYNTKPYTTARPHPAYNMGYHEGYDIETRYTEQNDVPFNPNFYAAKARKGA